MTSHKRDTCLHGVSVLRENDHLAMIEGENAPRTDKEGEATKETVKGKQQVDLEGQWAPSQTDTYK